MSKLIVCDVEIVWAAGFFDGEGCTRYQHHWDNKSPRDRPNGYRGIALAISQADREVLDRFQRAFGVGKVYARDGGRHFVYSVGTLDEVVYVIEEMWPYLGRIKRRQAQAAISKYCEDVPKIKKSHVVNQGLRKGLRV